MRALLSGFAVWLLMGSQALHAQAISNSDLANLIEDHWEIRLKRSPVLATSLGDRRYDDTLGSLSLSAMDKAKARYEDVLNGLKELDPSKLNGSDQLNYDLFEQELERDIASLSQPQRSILFNRFAGWHISFANLVDRVPFFALADYESYIARLNDFSRYNAEGIATTRWAIKNKYVQPCEAMQGYGRTISAQITTQPEQSRFWEPFKTPLASVDPQLWKGLKARARTAIEDRVMPALRLWADVFTREYMAACAENVGADDLPGGDTYYAERIKRYTTLDMLARQIHQTGLSEVSRIRREMRAVIDDARFNGSFQDFQAYLRTDPKFYAATPEALLERVAYIAKQADGALPTLFGRLPRMPYTVKPIPDAIAEGNTTAYYEQPSGDGTRAGVYRVNLTALDQRPLYELEALTLHEAVPGHHLQIALQQELKDLPNFRRFGGYTAFIEGWGLYAERLGLEMGFYKDPYSNFGRLSYEMWRACRLVVDTGLHALGWTRQQAIDFMADNTALSAANIEAEVDRYITWPGQALAYKLGEIKIRDLRAFAEKTLGDAFDLRAFHDALLAEGALPLTTLDKRMRGWVEAQTAP